MIAAYWVHFSGQMHFRKVAKNFGQCAFLSAREFEHGRFRALFAGTFWPKMQNGRNFTQKEAVSPQHSAKPTPKPEYNRVRFGDRPGAKVGGGGVIALEDFVEVHANLG